MRLCVYFFLGLTPGNHSFLVQGPAGYQILLTAAPGIFHSDGYEAQKDNRGTENDLKCGRLMQDKVADDSERHRERKSNRNYERRGLQHSEHI